MGRFGEIVVLIDLSRVSEVAASKQPVSKSFAEGYSAQYFAAENRIVSRSVSDCVGPRALFTGRAVQRNRVARGT
ncbi:MAG: hypothetical protein DMF06_15160 [Verrucomicrobia bacterium]|nr:MAG: hypothetical protein DMF06_15160 [Verrucomicrobiota bacterium]